MAVATSVFSSVFSSSKVPNPTPRVPRSSLRSRGGIRLSAPASSDIPRRFRNFGTPGSLRGIGVLHLSTFGVHGGALLRTSPATLSPARASRDGSQTTEQTESPLVRWTVAFLTEALRASGFGTSDSVSEPLPVDEGRRISSETSILDIIREDYEKRAYFLTGDISDDVYDENCYFGDPTVKFTGREKWKRNIKLLIPFFEDQSIILKEIFEIKNENQTQIQTQWVLKTYLKFPWRPLIAIDGSTLHTLNAEGTKVVRHVESWEVSGIAAIFQMFIPSERSKWK